MSLLLLFANKPDTSPESFGFTAVDDADLDTLYTSNTITPTGFDSPAAISVTNGEYSINGGAFTSSPGTFSPGDEVQVRGTSSDLPGGVETVTLTIGGVDGEFVVTAVNNARIFDDGGDDYRIFDDGATDRRIYA